MKLAKEHGLNVFVHDRNHGYGRNQKTCYREALTREADVIVMLHPDYQYSPKLVTAMAATLAAEEYDLVLGSRILGGKARSGGMPLYKYVFNRILTLTENLIIGSKLSEFHTGYRAFSRDCLQRLPIQENSDDFMFDNEMIAQAIFFDFRVGELSCPSRYFPEASSINFRRSVTYGLGVLWTAVRFRLQKLGWARFRIFERSKGEHKINYYRQINQTD